MEELQSLNIDGTDINISEPISKELVSKEHELTSNIEPVSKSKNKSIEPVKNKSKKVTFDNTSMEDNFNIYGFVVPKSTAYLTIILFIVGFIIWYITYHYDQKIKSQDKKE